MNLEANSNRIPKLILLAGVFSCSLSSAFVKSMTTPSCVTATYRLFMAVLLLTPYVFLKKEMREEVLSMSKKDLLWSALAGVFFAFHLFTWFESLRFTTVASSTVLCNTEVIFAAIGYILFFGKRLKKGEFI